MDQTDLWSILNQLDAFKYCQHTLQLKRLYSSLMQDTKFETRKERERERKEKKKDKKKKKKKQTRRGKEKWPTQDISSTD